MPRVALQRREDGSFWPFSQEDWDACSEYKTNQLFYTELHGVRKPRSLQQLKLFWACCRKVADNASDEEWDTQEKVAEQVKLELRYIDSYMVVDGRVHIKTKSISFETLPHMEACNLFPRAWPIMARKIRITVEELLENAEA